MPCAHPLPLTLPSSRPSFSLTLLFTPPQISRAEFHKAMGVLGYKVSKEAINLLFDEWDSDGELETPAPPAGPPRLALLV